jgi:hypothetical protein
MAPDLIITFLIAVFIIGAYLVFLYKKAQPEIDFEKYFKSGDLEKTRAIYNAATRGNGFPPLGLGLRQLVSLISQNAGDKDILELGRKIFRFHPNASLPLLKGCANRMGVLDEKRLSAYFREIEFTYMAELISGAIPDYPSPEYTRSFINKRGTGISLGKKFLDEDHPQSKVLYRSATNQAIGVSPRLEELLEPCVSVLLSRHMTPEDRMDLKINIRIDSGKITTNTTDLLSAFDLQAAEVRAYMDSLTGKQFEDFLRCDTLYGTTSLEKELKDKLVNKYVQMISGMVLFIKTRHLSAAMNTLELDLQARMPFFWREKQSKEHFLMNMVEHQFKVHQLKCFAESSLKYHITADAMTQDAWDYQQKLQKEIEPLVSINTLMTSL